MISFVNNGASLFQLAAAANIFQTYSPFGCLPCDRLKVIQLPEIDLCHFFDNWLKHWFFPKTLSYWPIRFVLHHHFALITQN